MICTYCDFKSDTSIGVIQHMAQKHIYDFSHAVKDLINTLDHIRKLHIEGILPIMGEEHHLCVNCMHKYPCPTVNILNGVVDEYTTETKR